MEFHTVKNHPQKKRPLLERSLFVWVKGESKANYFVLLVRSFNRRPSSKIWFVEGWLVFG
jgi:hypothetical protein